MNCPVCGTTALAETELERNLTGLRCAACEGVWIPSARYRNWMDRHGGSLPEKSAGGGAPMRPRGFERVRPCPECGALLARYEVGHGVPFRIDHCGRCGGFWLDRGEFEALKARNLHDDLHAIFLDSWQQGLRKERTDALVDRRMSAALGEADFNELKRIKEWLARHPKKAWLIAYLRD